MGWMVGIGILGTANTLSFLVVGGVERFIKFNHQPELDVG